MKSRAILRDKKYSILLFIPAVLSTLAISQGDSTLAPHGIVQLFQIINWGCILFLLPYVLKQPGSKPFILWPVFSWFILFNFYNVNGVQISGLLTFLYLCLFYKLDGKILNNVVRYFRYYLIFSAFLGIVAYFDFLLGLGLPHSIEEYYIQRDNANYINYTFAYLFVELDGIRLCGLFNEPGAFGTFLALFLILDGFNYKHYGNYLLLIAGCLTLSMAFFVLVFLGFVMTVIKSKTKIILTILFVSAAIYIIPKIHFSDYEIEYFISRFEYDTKEHKFKGDNRKNYSFISVEKEFDQGDNKLLGYGTGYCGKRGVILTLSYKTAVIEWGYLGFFLSYGLLMFAAFRLARKARSSLILTVCFLLSIYQRPSVFSIAYFVVLFGGISYLQSFNSNKI